MALNYSQVTTVMSISLVSNEEVSLLKSSQIRFLSFSTTLNPGAKQAFHLLFNKHSQVKEYIMAKAAQLGSQTQNAQ